MPDLDTAKAALRRLEVAAELRRQLRRRPRGRTLPVDVEAPPVVDVIARKLHLPTDVVHADMVAILASWAGIDPPDRPQRHTGRNRPLFERPGGVRVMNPRQVDVLIDSAYGDLQITSGERRQVVHQLAQIALDGGPLADDLQAVADVLQDPAPTVWDHYPDGRPSRRTGRPGKADPIPQGTPASALVVAIVSLVAETARADR
jgi:hypothetical protein